MTDSKNIDALWDDSPIDVTAEANMIWNIANKLRGVYMPDKYGDVIIPMTIIRRLECALEDTKDEVVKEYKKNPNIPYKAMCKKSGLQFYNTSEFSLKELLNDQEHIESNFKAYISGFSSNVQDLLLSEDTLNFQSHIKTMSKGGCLYQVIKEFSEKDLSPFTYDSIKMGYIFENLIGRFFQNVDAGQYYTGRDIIKLCVSLLIAEGCEDIFDDSKIITVCDQACGTGGMLSTAYSYLKHYNPTADVRLFGQEYNGVSYAIGLAEMLIKGQNSDNFRHADTFKTDCFEGTKMRFVIENPPFGTPWSGESSKDGQEEEVKKEYEKSDWSKGVKKMRGRWGAGLPSGGDSQLLFVQSAVAKLNDENGRAAIIENGSPLFTGSTASGESQIRRWLLENDLIEAIIQLPTDLFYNTGIATYIWILSKNKRKERKGKTQLIDASSFYHKLRKPAGKKKYEFSPEDRLDITKLYSDFVENEFVKIFDNTEFIYKEYSVMQPLQRSYGLSVERIENMLAKGSLSSLYDESKVYELEHPVVKESKNQKKKSAEAIRKEEEKARKKRENDKKKLEEYYLKKPLYDKIIERINNAITDEKWLEPEQFVPILENVLNGLEIDKKLFERIMDGLSIMDKEAKIHTIEKGKNKGDIIFDTETKDIELVRWDESIEDYMAREVIPHVPDAQWFWEEKLDAKKPVIKIGAEIPFTRYFYKYQKPEASENLEKEFIELETSVSDRIAKLFV
ncbi:MAG: N-6 DNA methylase [Eubacterium sp.]|nr:N-6 DNA methylase [Eubacterium sp.]